MNKTVSIIITLVVVGMTSCKKDFITLNPESTVSLDVLYKTDKDFRMLL